MPVQRCQVDNKPGWKWGESGKCYTGPDAKAKAAAQGRAAHAEKSMILQLATFPASNIGLSSDGLTQYRKELIKVGKYVYPATKEAFEVTTATLSYWVKQFQRWIGNGNRISIPLGHDKADNPEENQGWVTDMFVEGDSLFGIMELINPKLALTTDVSISVPVKVVDGKGNVYKSMINHVALCVDPVIGGLEKFKVLSLSIGETNMEFLKKLAKALGMSNDTPTEELVMSEVEKLNLKEADKVKLSRNTTNADYVVKMLSENRSIKLSNLLKAGLITPAVKDVITAKYVEIEALTLSMSTKGDDGFDLLYDVLVQNKPVKLEEVTGVQNLELANQSVEQPNAMQKDIARRRKDAGMDK